MPSTNKTPFLGLSNFEGTDKPNWPDWNTDMQKLDDYIKEVKELLDLLKENIEKRTDPLAQTVGETILSSVLEYPTHTLGYMGTKAPDAPPGYGGSWAKIFSIGGSKNYGLTVYFMANDSITVFTRSIVNGAWTESSWTEVVSNPAWFVLPLFTGFLSVADHACMYSKEGCTTFVKGILRVTDINKVGSEFAQLPNGYQLKDGLSSKFLGLREGTNGTVQIATYRDGNLQFSLPSWEMSVGDEIRIDGSFKQ